MPKPKTINDPVLEKALKGYNKDPSTIDVMSAVDKAYLKKVNEALHDNLPSSVVKNQAPTELRGETLLNVSSVQDQDYVSRSFGPKSRMKHKSKPANLAKPVQHDPTLEKALKGYKKDPTKIDVFTAQDKAYLKQVNFGLGHNLPSSSLKNGAPEKATPDQKKVDELLDVSSWQDQDFVSRSFGPKSRHH